MLYFTICFYFFTIYIKIWTQTSGNLGQLASICNDTLTVLTPYHTSLLCQQQRLIRNKAPKSLNMDRSVAQFFFYLLLVV